MLPAEQIVDNKFLIFFLGKRQQKIGETPFEMTWHFDIIWEEENTYSQ